VEFTSRIDASVDEEFNAWFAVLQRSEQRRDGERGQGWHPDEWRASSIDESARQGLPSLLLSARSTNPWLSERSKSPAMTTSPSSKGTSSSIRPSGVAGTVRRSSPNLKRGARDLDRPTLIIFVIEGSREIGAGPNRSFAAHHGYRVAEENVRRDLDWPRPAGELDRLGREWSPFASDYEIISWTNGTPEELIEGRAHLSAIMPAETPHVDIDVEAEHWDAARVRLHEATTNRDGT
jgi:hypothetical protein